jgi:Domain of unknown function (DUF6379)
MSMFDRYIIVEGSLRNVDGGFAFEIRMPYYRGLGLSMVEDVAVTVDGHRYPREAITFGVHGNAYTLEAMETEYEDRWEFGEPATVTVAQPGGLAPGEHVVGNEQRLRISYLPWPGGGSDEKTLVVRGAGD